MKDAWTQEDNELLKKLAGEGYSASQIAGHFRNRSRNSVIGRLHRMGVSLTSPSVNRARNMKRKNTITKPTNNVVVKPKLVPKTKFAPLPPNEAFVSPINGHEPVSFADNEGCWWPIGNMFCGGPKEEDKSYCPQHAATGRKEALPYRRRY